jgi:hypothetical protein
MSEDNTIEYTIEENDKEMNQKNEPVKPLVRSENGLNGIPPHVVSQLPSEFFASQSIEHSDAYREFMLKHNTNMQNEGNMINIHPSEYFKKIIMKVKTD